MSYEVWNSSGLESSEALTYQFDGICLDEAASLRLLHQVRKSSFLQGRSKGLVMWSQLWHHTLTNQEHWWLFRWRLLLWKSRESSKCPCKASQREPPVQAPQPKWANAGCQGSFFLEAERKKTVIQGKQPEPSPGLKRAPGAGDLENCKQPVVGF